MNALHWLFAFLGLWIVVSPWALGFHEVNTVVANNVVVGVVLLVGAVWALYGRR